MCMSTRARVVLVKLETTPNVDAVPVAGTDDLYVLDTGTETIASNISVQTVQAASPDGATRITILQNRKPTTTLRIPMYVHGVDNDGDVQVPRWMSVILQTAGCLEVDNSTPSVFARWYPDPISPTYVVGASTTTAGKRTFTLYEYIGRDGSVEGGTKILRKMIGCKVSAMRIVQTVNEMVILEVDILGRYVIDSSSTADLSLWDDDGVTTGLPLVIGGTNQFQASQQTPTITATITLGTSSITDTLNFGGEHVEGDDGASGVTCIENAGGIDATLTANPIMKSSDIGAWSSYVDQLQHAKVTNNVPYAPQNESTAGKRITIVRPNVQGIGDPTRDGAAIRRGLQLSSHYDPAGATAFARAPLGITIT